MFKIMKVYIRYFAEECEYFVAKAIKKCPGLTIWKKDEKLRYFVY